MPLTPTILFPCIHSAGRSQMALGWFRHLADDHASAYSAGSEPAADLNPVAVEAMADVGIDIAGLNQPAWPEFRS